MKPQQLATLLNISPVTLRHWCLSDFREFLSPSAQGVNGAKRSFDDRDARILAWVALLKTQNMLIKDIVVTLRASRSDNWQNLPLLPGSMAGDEPIAVVPREAVEERLRALQERFEVQLEIVVKERDELKSRLETADRNNTTLQHETSATIQELQRRITELSVREAELRGKLEQYMIGNRRWSMSALVITALVGGIALTLITLVLLTILHR